MKVNKLKTLIASVSLLLLAGCSSKMTVEFGVISSDVTLEDAEVVSVTENVEDLVVEENKVAFTASGDGTYEIILHDETYGDMMLNVEVSGSQVNGTTEGEVEFSVGAK